jgi:DNA-binding transcriptional LysR family regulator
VPFDLTDLGLFSQVVEAGSITAGAQKAHLTLAAASARIRGMEDSLGLRLLHRERRGVRATDAGISLVHHARLILAQHERMHDELGRYVHGFAGRVRLLCPTAILTEFLPEVLGPYLADHPKVSIDLQERPSQSIVRELASGEADVGIMARTSALPGLEAFPFRTLRFVLATPLHHPLASRRSVAFRDALEHDFVGLAQGSATQKYLEDQAARLGKQVRYRVRMREFPGVCRMVEDNVGIAVIPESAAGRGGEAGALRLVRLKDAWASRQFLLCVRRFDLLPAYAKDLIERIRA